MMMKCYEFEENIIALYEEELDEATAARMREHMLLCAKCEVLYRQVTATYTSFDNIPDIPAPDVKEFYEETVVKAGLKDHTPVITLMHRLAKVAAAVIFLAGLAAGIIAGTQVLQSGNGSGTQQDSYYSSLASDFYLSTENAYSVDNYLATEAGSGEQE